MPKPNFPETIYLQYNPDDDDGLHPYDPVTWCKDRVNNEDVPYVRADLLHKYIFIQGKLISSDDIKDVKVKGPDPGMAWWKKYKKREG